eukprot:gene11831-10232_t
MPHIDANAVDAKLKERGVYLNRSWLEACIAHASGGSVASLDQMLSCVMEHLLPTDLHSCGVAVIPDVSAMHGVVLD